MSTPETHIIVRGCKGGVRTSTLATGLALELSKTAPCVLHGDGDNVALLGMPDATLDSDTSSFPDHQLFIYSVGEATPMIARYHVWDLSVFHSPDSIDHAWRHRILADRTPAHIITMSSLCYLSARHLSRMLPVQLPDGPRHHLVVASEPHRALTEHDIVRAASDTFTSVHTFDYDPAVARAIDAGLLSTRLPRTFANLLRSLHDLVA